VSRWIGQPPSEALNGHPLLLDAGAGPSRPPWSPLLLLLLLLLLRHTPINFIECWFCC
jgi:hypothetical protein